MGHKVCSLHLFVTVISARDLHCQGGGGAERNITGHGEYPKFLFFSKCIYLACTYLYIKNMDNSLKPNVPKHHPDPLSRLDDRNYS